MRLHLGQTNHAARIGIRKRAREQAAVGGIHGLHHFDSRRRLAGGIERARDAFAIERNARRIEPISETGDGSYAEAVRGERLNALVHRRARYPEAPTDIGARMQLAVGQHLQNREACAHDAVQCLVRL